MRRSDVWSNAVNKTRGLKDGLGMPIDFEITPTVAILRLMGFRTTSSCAGHLRRITNGPYVIFVSPKARKYEIKLQQIGNYADPEYKTTAKKATRESVRERQRLIAYLKTFYANRHKAYDQQLVVCPLGLSASQLYCLGVDRALIVGEKDRKILLEADREEIRAFTEYLKTVYFSSDN